MPRKRSADEIVTAKVEYVRKAPDEKGHTCHFPGCGKACKPAFWGCRECWYKLPAYLRSKVWKAYRPGQEQDKRPSREYLAVAREVEEWIHDNLLNKSKKT